ncbi:MAG TPA: nuclear transport factor 2 family protein [Acetobacteraceae bacterium]|nr:nuclear transport factor 2 family protein [Acetobacteraceae bacterium]
MSNVNEAVIRYISVWNERDPKRRRALIAETWTDDGIYIDAHRNGAGHEEIDALVEAAQEQFPGYRVNLISGIETHNDFARFRYAAGGTMEAPLYIGGTDFVTVAPDGRLRAVVGFIDEAPAPMK